MLASIGFALWGLPWAVYFMLDGFDLGVGMALPGLARDEADRKRLYRAIGPFWDGNEVWLIAAGGITFAAFPRAYGVIFSVLYAPLMAVLFMLIIRGAAVALRPELPGAAGRKALDALFVGSSVAAAFLFGIVFAALFKGLPINAAGDWQGPLTPGLAAYALAGGAAFLAMFALHGRLWLAAKTEGRLAERAGAGAKKLFGVVVAIAILFLLLTAGLTELGSAYLRRPLFFFIPALMAAALVMEGVWLWRGAWMRAWAASCGSIALLVFSGLAGIYPALLPSSLDPAWDVTIHNAASGPYTLKIMLAVALALVPVVSAYQLWVYRLFRGPAGEDEDGY